MGKLAAPGGGIIGNFRIISPPKNLDKCNALSCYYLTKEVRD
jgi:hypothetical protein